MREPIIKVTPEEWDAQYRAGSWDYLLGVTAHYGVIGSLILKHACHRVLDVGCGRCLLKPFVFSSNYTGLDFCLAALMKDGTRAGCILGDATTLPVQTKNYWDCAVFCESLYYMPDPLEVLARYFGFCKIIFLSIMISDKTAALIRSIRERFTVVDDFQLASVNGGGWEIMAVKP